MPSEDSGVPIQGEQLAPENRAALLERDAVFASRYTVLERLRIDLLGVSYRVRDQEDDERGGERLLKILLPSLAKDELGMTRLDNAISDLNAISSACVVPVLHSGADPESGLQFYITENIEDESLGAILANNGGKLPLHTVLDLGGRIAESLASLHQQTTHRNLTPRNIIIARDGSVRFIDCGLTRAYEPTYLAQASVAFGTNQYLAPEQRFQLYGVDKRADVFALGSILFEMLTGESPVGTLEAPSNVTAGVPEILDATIMKCLEPDKEKRPTSVGPILDAIEVSDDAQSMVRAVSVPLVALATMVLGIYVAFYTDYIPEDLRDRWSYFFFPGDPNDLPTAHAAGDVFPTFDPALSERASDFAPQPPPVVLPQDVMDAKMATESSRARARDAGSNNYFPERDAQANELFNTAAAHFTLGNHDQAAESFELALAHFDTLAFESKDRRIRESEHRKAKLAVEVSRAEAEAVGAERWSADLYAQARGQESEAEQSKDMTLATLALAQSDHLYRLALAETRRQDEPMADLARRDAETAEEQTRHASVLSYAAEELSDAKRLFDDATAAGEDFAQARRLFIEAAEAFAVAHQTATERETAAQAEMAQSQTSALAARDSISALERQYAGPAVNTGDAHWDAALKRTDDPRAARDRFELARLSYEEAIRTAAEPPAGDARIFSGIDFVYVPAGEFTMGSEAGAPGRRSNEAPRRVVELTQGFWMGRYEISKAEWQRVMGSAPWLDQDGTLNDVRTPAVFVSWDDIQDFLQALNQKREGRFRLPTEAEWEYASRAGGQSAYSFGDDPAILVDYAWYDKNARSKGDEFAHRVGQLRPNAWGLFDMHGNVWEWCADWYGPYAPGRQTDPTGPSSGSRRVERGGGWSSKPEECRSANRYRYEPDHRFSNIGFRIVRDY